MDSGTRTGLRSRPRRRAGRITDIPMGKEAYEVDGPRVIPAQPLAAVALVRAQDAAQRVEGTATFTVYRVPLFGPRVELFRVVRDEDGNVTTFTLKRED